jgi:hypothetical protein
MMDDLQYAKTRIRPSAMRELAVELHQVTWEDVGGLNDVKQRLGEAVTAQLEPHQGSRLSIKVASIVTGMVCGFPMSLGFTLKSFLEGKNPLNITVWFVWQCEQQWLSITVWLQTYLLTGSLICNALSYNVTTVFYPAVCD